MEQQMSDPELSPQVEQKRPWASGNTHCPLDTDDDGNCHLCVRNPAAHVEIARYHLKRLTEEMAEAILTYANDVHDSDGNPCSCGICAVADRLRRIGATNE